jgi:DNA-binding LacI/PurR family transcriptional regulator
MATMADIARRAGVSLSTVSYVISGKRPISEETAARVRAAMDDLAFRPHAAGRALASGRNRTIALLFPVPGTGVSEMQLEFFTSAAEEASRHGYGFFLSTAPNDDMEMLRLAGSGYVDGLILMEVSLHDRRVDLLRARNVPFALIGHRADNAGISFVDLDFAAAIDLAMDHLADLGHRRVAFVNAPAPLLAAGYGPAVRSAAAFASAAARLGLRGDAFPCDPSPEAGARLMDGIAALDPPATAVLSVNGDSLAGLLRRTRDRGEAIPGDRSFIAVTSDRVARHLAPPLTTVDFPVAEMGRIGAELLIRQLEGGEADRAGQDDTQVLLRGELRVRKSSGPAPIPAAASLAGGVAGRD